MASRAVPIVLRFARLLPEHVINARNYGHFRSITQTSNSNNKWFNGIKKLSAAPSEEPKPPVIEESEIEKKLRLDIEGLTKEVQVVTEKEQLMNDKYKRALADGENLRKRLTKQIEDAKMFGIQGFCKDLLEVADVLGRATESVPLEEINQQNPYLKSLFEGLTMTEAQLQKVFKAHGLQVVNPINEKFNPNFHEALFQQEVAGKEPGIVIQVSKIGYKLHERVVRPALVGVTKGP